MKRVPNTYVIVFFIIILSAIITWFLPGGKYIDTTIIENGVEKTVKVFQYQDNSPQTWQVFSALFKGFTKQSGIIIFILMIGGAFWIMNSTKAIDVGIVSFLRLTKRLEHIKVIQKLGVENIIITLIMLLFSAFGAIFGMSEETIAFIVILVPLAISMGYDSITGVAMVFVAAGLGFAGAILNPFTIGIAQGLADIPIFSGIEYRMFCWVIINIVGISYVLWYAKKIKSNPQKSIVYNEDAYWRKKNDTADGAFTCKKSFSAWIVYGIVAFVLALFAFMPSLSIFVDRNDVVVNPDPVQLGFISLVQTRLAIGNAIKIMPILPILFILFVVLGIVAIKRSTHFFILLLLFYTMIMLVVGVMGYEWYILKIATIFLAMGIFSGIVMAYDANKIVKEFLEGVKDIMSAAMIVGLAGGIIVVLEDGRVIDTILYGLSKSMDSFGEIASVSVMYVIQTIINVVIPSGSAKAALTMPIMAPFSDLIGISRQATVMAFQFGDGFTNMITPTSGVLIAVLGVAKIPYEKWVKWITPLMIILILLGWLLLIPTVTMQLNGF